MITLITGTPGAGKTLYTVANLLRDLVGSEVDSTDDNGQPCKIPRVVFTNINGFMLDHEKIDGRDGGGLADWHKWAKPGSVICFDEVQKEWPVRPNGSKVPECIQALETHRHMGVDFIVITQGPNLIDQNLRSLVGRHLHVRRLGGIGGSVVYEWDHCSRQLLYSKAMAKKPFRYPKDAFQLYKSAELHTKPKASVPMALWFAGAALAGSAFFVPYAMNRIGGKVDMEAKGKTEPAKTAQAAPSPPADPNAVTVKESKRHLKIPDLPRDPFVGIPPPPVPLDALEYAGTLRSDEAELHLFRRPGGGVIKSETLVSMGYKIKSEDGCTLTVSYAGQDRHFLCTLGPTPAPSNVKPPPADIRRALERLAPSKPQQVAHWPSDGLAMAQQRPAF